MKVPFLDLKAQLPQIRKEIEERFSRIVDNTGFVCGREVKEFEERFADLHDVSYAVGLSSGTEANQIACLCCGIGEGDEVIIPANTFIATAEGISHAGAVPVFADVDETTFNIDGEFDTKITPKTKAVNPVHLFGQPADMAAVLDIAQKNKLPVIEDSAQAHCAEFRGKRVGGIGKAASWSFYPGKNLGAWGEAGALTTDDENICRQALKLRDHGSEKKYFHDLIGFNCRMSEFQAAVLNVKMDYIEEWTEKRRRNAERYSEGLSGLEEVAAPVESEGARHVYHLFVVRAQERDELQEYLKDKDIGCGMHYPIPLHLTEAYAYLGYRPGDFPKAENLAKEILSLPMYPEISGDQIDYVCECIQDFYKR
jgi:dTDP-4-amino-4,6-dideoxygalactose transaminase